MSYPAEHSPDDCDRCLKQIGKDKLIRLPFQYLDRNDIAHPDEGRSYRQYYVCKNCLKTEGCSLCQQCGETIMRPEGLCGQCTLTNQLGNQN